MTTLPAKVERLIISEDGPTAVEYAIMLALIVVVCLTTIRLIGTETSTTFDTAASELG
jgi:pilus assembly protein Flp/PilA